MTKIMKPKNKGLILIGTGKVAYHLGKSFIKNGIPIKGIWGRNKRKTKELADQLFTTAITDIKEIKATYLVIICITDSAIQDVVSKLSQEIKIAYTSGSIKLEDLPAKKYLGVFYPLQTFSKDSKVDFSTVPFLIESTSKELEMELMELASHLSSKVIQMDSESRFHLHIAAVMVNNFTNFLYALAAEHLEEHQLHFELLQPLIRETINKLDHLTPKEAQTGPAFRGDQEVIKAHLQAISSPGTKKIYQLMSQLITEEFANKKI